MGLGASATHPRLYTSTSTSTSTIAHRIQGYPTTSAVARPRRSAIAVEPTRSVISTGDHLCGCAAHSPIIRCSPDWPSAYGDITTRPKAWRLSKGLEATARERSGVELGGAGRWRAPDGKPLRTRSSKPSGCEHAARLSAAMRAGSWRPPRSAGRARDARAPPQRAPRRSRRRGAPPRRSRRAG